MITMAQVYEGKFKGTLEDIPALTLKLKVRELELEEMFQPGKAVEPKLENEYHAIEYLRAANIMKAHLWDGIDDEKQTKIALQAMDIYTGLLEELWVSDKEFRLKEI